MATHAISPTVVLAGVSGCKYWLVAQSIAAVVELIAVLSKITARVTCYRIEQ